MSGTAGDTARTDEASEPLETNVSKPDTLAGRARESASHTREKIANRFQPGETKATSRRLSDTPSSMRQQFREFSPKESAKGSPSETTQKSKSMLQSAQESVARALGGGSRGAS